MSVREDCQAGALLVMRMLANSVSGQWRFTEATRLAADAFKVFSDMGHPFAFGGCSVILGQAGLHIGFGRSGIIELWDQIPAHLRPDAVDTTRVELPLGQAAAALGHLDPAAEDLQTAASICDANGARGCAVQARVELAAALTRQQAPGDRDEALAALAAAAREAEQPGRRRIRRPGIPPRHHPARGGQALHQEQANRAPEPPRSSRRR